MPEPRERLKVAAVARFRLYSIRQRRRSAAPHAKAGRRSALPRGAANPGKVRSTFPESEEAPGGASSLAESVSLSSAQPADFRLPPTAFERGFNLLASRARRNRHTRAARKSMQGHPMGTARILRTFLFSTFPQHFIQPVEKPSLFRPPLHTRREWRPFGG